LVERIGSVNGLPFAGVSRDSGGSGGRVGNGLPSICV